MFESINGKFDSTINESINTKEFKIKKLEEMTGAEKKVYGFIITKEGKYGRNVLIATDDCFISLPIRYTEKFKNLSIEEIEALKSGDVKICDIKKVELEKGSTYCFNLK